MSDNARAGGFGTYFDPTTGDAVVTRTGDLSGNWSVVCSDVLGRVIAQGLLAAGSQNLRFPIARYAGVVVITAIDPTGNKRNLGRLSSVR
jgi:hypothetical protein